MAKQYVTDAEFIAALRSEDGRNLGALVDRLVGSVTAHLRQIGANAAEAEELFYIGLTALWWRGRTGYPADFNFYSYLLQACKYQWYHDIARKKKANATVTLEDIGVLTDLDPSIQEILEQVEFNEGLYRYLDRLGKPCRTLLLLWAEGFSFEEIAQKMGYKNADSARQQKHKCLERLRKLMDEGH